MKFLLKEFCVGYGEDCVSPEAADLIQKLLTLDHTKRLGTSGVEEIKNHKFFEGINILALSFSQKINRN